ncbi:AVAST type 1 anti-phage system MBL fold metallo-hydrolase Avs1a [Siphonobacter curvatus]|uniref:Metallo-beta-lactamase domain-containing protein n=1 Tax=Siphonobacter curvatus TaxID=2094562 RepID=A0A2S7IG13_9BACT|nr:AVAST type 1 anti-phage system MBL fold metallo-hydrolase Avs1a [Siphonobacter curvatus]PQA54446.1 hypothetical protein C5O19_22110 [Siphonobacter curvatus]
MNINIKTYPAKNGDCFLISFGGVNDSKKHLIIDCGYVDTIKKYLKKDLIRIAEKGEVIEKLIITHIDKDHIQGAIRLLKDNNSEAFIEIKEIWHNTFRHLHHNEQTYIDNSQEKILNQITQKGYAVRKGDMYGQQEISAIQGTTVGALILQGDYNWNTDFDRNAVSIDYKKEISIDENTQIILLSPNNEKLGKLKILWKNELEKYGTKYEEIKSELYDDAFEMHMSWEKDMLKKKSPHISSTKESIEELLLKPFDDDTTITNGSSISFILEIQEKKLLFLADAHPDIIVQSLKEYDEKGLIKFDLIKVSHHGSFHNINKDLLDKIDSTKYIFSTNGDNHNHPHRETIAHIISRPSKSCRELYFNYITENSTYFDNEEWKNNWNYSINYLNQEPYTITL